MYLKKITLLLIVSVIISFSIRLLGTVFPLFFKSIFVVKTTIFFNTFFILVHLIFWLVFYREYISEIKERLKNICLLAVIGSLAVTVIYMKKLPFVFGMSVQFPPAFMNPYFDAIVPLTGSIFHLGFFIAFRKALVHEEKIRLGKPVLCMIIGISIFIVLHLIVLVNFIATKRFEWLEHMPRGVVMGTAPLIVVAVFLMLSFYVRFYKFLASENSIGKDI